MSQGHDMFFFSKMFSKCSIICGSSSYYSLIFSHTGSGRPPGPEGSSSKSGHRAPKNTGPVAPLVVLMKNGTRKTPTVTSNRFFKITFIRPQNVQKLAISNAKRDMTLNYGFNTDSGSTWR